MIAVRSVLFFVLFVLVTVGYSLLIVLSWPLTDLKQRQAIGRLWSRTVNGLLAILCQLRYQVEGLEQLPPPPFVIMAKHQSAWETVAFYAIFPPFVWVLKRSLGWIPFFGWALHATGQIFIDRGQMTEALKIIQQRSQIYFQQGVSLVVFPEGTRVEPGTVGDYKAGGIVIAMAAGVPIVPVAHNAGQFWRRRALLKYPGVIRVRIGPAIATEGLSRTERKALLSQVRDSIEGMMLTEDG
ncbi:MAG: 1-acyl-sn-glycerol-3-phosphate acyltransferase [Magnetococcales bacterium]|nr:1-acyl-sn-glycerol-3-phosphate acyltransferase [Magnetococcales bacterium]